MDVSRFDPTDPSAWYSAWSNAMRTMMPATLRYENVDPRVQEIAILATMHNMASLLHESEPLKTLITAELAKRAAKLAS